MIHLALVILAIILFWKVGLFAFQFIGESFSENIGCGCLSIVVVIVFGAIVLAIAC